MKWRSEHRYEYGDVRVTERFLVLPWVSFSDEWRWWEKAKFVQKCLGTWLGITLWSLPYRWADTLPVGDISFAQYVQLQEYDWAMAANRKSKRRKP